VIEGAEEPLETLVQEARKLVGDFDTFERRVSAYLANERTSGQWDDAELEAEIGALRISSLNFRWPIGRIAVRGGLSLRGNYEPLVSEATFYRVQAILDGRVVVAGEESNRRAGALIELRCDSG
jgi:hypothetical protein